MKRRRRRRRTERSIVVKGNEISLKKRKLEYQNKSQKYVSETWIGSQRSKNVRESIFTVYVPRQDIQGDT